MFYFYALLSISLSLSLSLSLPLYCYFVMSRKLFFMDNISQRTFGIYPRRRNVKGLFVERDEYPLPV